MKMFQVWTSTELVFVSVVEIDLVFVSGHRSRLSFREFCIALARGVKFHIKSYAKPFENQSTS